MKNEKSAKEKCFKWFRRDIVSYVSILIILLFIFILRKPLFVILMIILGGLSTIHKKFTQISFGFELITLFSVVITYAHGPIIGIISAVLMVFISHLILGRICVTMFAKMGIYFFIILLAALFAGSALPISTVGIILSVIFYAVFLIINIFFFGYNPVSSIASSVGGIIFNYIFFTKLAEILLKILI